MRSSKDRHGGYSSHGLLYQDNGKKGGTSRRLVMMQTPSHEVGDLQTRLNSQQKVIKKPVKIKQ